MRRKNVMLVGFTGVWKTTVANHISQKFCKNQNTKSEDVRAWLQEKFPKLFPKNLKSKPAKPHKIEAVIVKTAQTAELLMKGRFSRDGIVFNACNLQEKTRANALKILGDAIIVEVTANENELLERLKVQDLKNWAADEYPAGLCASQNLYDAQKNLYQAPKSDIIYNTSLHAEGDFIELDQQLKELLK